MARTNRRTVRRGLPRDEMVSRGEASREKHDHPWEYEAQVKSGTRRTTKVKTEAYNLVDLFGQIISEKAREGEDLFVWNVAKILKSQSRSISDY